MSDASLDPGWWEAREEWALAFVLLGGHGYRPKLTAETLLAYRADAATITITGYHSRLPSPRYGSPIALAVRDGAGSQVHSETILFDDDRQLVQTVTTRFAEHPTEDAPQETFIRHFPPCDEFDRLTLAAAYAAYRTELDTLAARGIHAYLEESGFGMRIYSDISPTLLLDISIDDEGLPPVGPEEGDWVVFITGPDGHEAEFTIDRTDDRFEAAETLATALTQALARVLRDGHVLLEHYDPRRGRLDPTWLRSPEA